VFFGAEIGQPIPAKHAFHTDHLILTIGTDQFQEPMWLSRDILMQTDFPFVVQDTHVHHLGVQIDPTVIAMRSIVESHLTTLLIVAVTLIQPPKSRYTGGRL
jgi:hypothetical protein